MIDSKYRISLDVNSTASNVRLKCKRGDTGRTIYAALTESGYPYHITDDCYAVFTATKPDGKKVYNGCKIEGCMIVYELTPQTVAVPGLVKCEIKLYGADDKLLTSASFLLEVCNAQVNDGDELESETEVEALTQLISQAIGMTVKLETLPNFGSGAKVGDYLMVSEVDNEKRMVTVIPADAPSVNKPADLSGYAKERWVQEGFQPKGEYLTKPSKAIVGQFFCVKEVDCNGKVISVEAVDAPAGGGSGVYVGDEDEAVLAEILIDPDDPPADYIPAPMVAAVGQTVVVEQINDAGVPTKWSPADLPSIPDALPNPQPLTIGGQSYDGSTAVSVNLPAGGGGGNVHFESQDFTLPEDADGFDIQLPVPVKNLIMYNLVIARSDYAPGVDKCRIFAWHGGNNVEFAGTTPTGSTNFTGFRYGEYIGVTISTRHQDDYYEHTVPSIGAAGKTPLGNGNKISIINMTDGVVFPAGTRIMFWGVYFNENL